MHELFLSATVPSHQHDQLLCILSSVAAMSPTPLRERHLVYRPARDPPVRAAAGVGQVGGSQDIAPVKRRAKDENGEAWYTKLVHTMEGEGSGGGEWHTRVDELPDAIRRPVTSRAVKRMPIEDDMDVGNFAKGRGLKCAYLLLRGCSVEN